MNLKKAFELDVIEAIRRPEHEGAYERIQQLTWKKTQRRRMWRTLWIMLALFVVGVASGFLSARWWEPEPKEVSARITVPRPNSSSAREILVQGTITHLPRGRHLLLAVERNGLMWPKEAELRIEGSTWEATIFDLGVEDGAFKLSVWSVSPAGLAEIREWLQESRKTNDFHGLRGIPGAVWLDAVNLNAKR